MYIRKIITIFIALMMGISACTSAAQPTATSTPLPPTATVPPSTATLPPPTLAPTAAPPPPTLAAVPIVEGSFPVGAYLCKQGQNKYIYKFAADGRYNEEITAYMGDAFTNETDAGIYTVNGDQITFTLSSSTGGDCPGNESGTYSWSLDGQTLRFKSLGDKCGIREYTNEACEWVVQP